MRIEIFDSYCLVLFFVMGTQSPSEVARDEAARRLVLDQQGIEAKVIEGEASVWAPKGNVTQWKPSAAPPPKESSKSPSPKGSSDVSRYRNAIQRMDKAIRQEEKRLELKQERFEASRWTLPKVGPLKSTRNRTTDERAKLLAEIEEIQEKIKELRQERIERYEDGKKAGFLPGELDGKGIVP
jgi:flagellar biosynthesis/type III secretory pathway protein FliH